MRSTLKQVEQERQSPVATMGIGDFFNKSWNWVVDTAKNVVTTVKEGAKKVVDKAREAVRKVGDVVKNVGGKVVSVAKTVASEAYGDAKGVVNFVGDRIKQGQDILGDTAKGLSGALSSPFTWLAVGIVGIVVLTKA